MIRTRFAPSPTGYLHVGGLRTALYAYLVAKQAGGQFLLRIEDTDRERLVEGGTLNILKSLYWAGLIPYEGVVLKNDSTVAQLGNKGPYIQSERLEIYQKYADELLAAGNAYYCFCTTERLEQMKTFQQKNKLSTGYDGHCLKLTASEIENKLKKSEKYVIRLKMPKMGETIWNDLVRGEVKFRNEFVDDQVLIKSDGFPTYHLAVVVDDHLMEITHVIRGEEWVSSTPKHLQLYKYFDWQPPQFAHLPLLLNPDKSKLSKRQGDVAVSDYEKARYLPAALINFVAFLGWNPGTEKEIFNLDDLIKSFSLEKINKSGAVFNILKLDWYNREYIKKMTNGQLAQYFKEMSSAELLDSFYLDAFREADLIKEGGNLKELRWLEKVVALERERINTLAELPQAVKFIFKLPDYQKELLVWRKGTLEETQKILSELKNYLNTFSVQEWNKNNLEERIKIWIGEREYNTGSVLWPLRVSLSGQQNSPGPFEIADVLGKKESLSRIDFALQKLN